MAAVLAIPACSGSAPAPPRPSPAPSSAPASEPGLTSVTGKASRGTFIVLEPTTPRQFPVPNAPVVMDQLGKQFIPAVLVARAGQPVEFRNSEDIPHNVYVIRRRTGTEVFNVSTDPSQKYVHAFDQPGQYDVSCDIHLGMLASVFVITTPYAAVADEQGSFAILNVSPGSYRMVASYGEKNAERTVEVAGSHIDIGNSGV
ncbi:MAG: plastocyanin/azurin family copper-binding protein [Vicinamibacterales bacterium]